MLFFSFMARNDPRRNGEDASRQQDGDPARRSIESTPNSSRR